MEYKITDIEFHDNRNPEEREVVVTLNNGSKIHIESCYESFQQLGGTTKEFWLTVGVAECVNDWLHGIGEQPVEVYEYIK